MIGADRIPVIVGVGEAIDRETDLSRVREPLDLMAAARRDADRDAAGAFLHHVDSIDVVNQISWRYRAPEHELCARLGLSPARAAYGPVGGETPVRFLHAAAARIRNGTSEVAAICGGEAHRSVARALREDLDLPWTPPAIDAARSERGQDRARPLAKRLGAHLPATFYPFFETAQAHRSGSTPRQALDETGRLYAAMSQVAAGNPSAWLQRAYSAAEIIEATPSNRMIADPYRKLMVANIAVNQGAAIIVTSLARARAAGLDDGRLIFIHRGFAAAEPDDPLSRDRYDRCVARDTVLNASLAAAGENGFDLVELYSCFPCVPKAAAATLGLPADAVPTVTGGLTFFGAPLNNYMAHATAAMVRRLRDERGRGLLYAQGGFATKHHTLILGSSPADDLDAIARDPGLQTHVDQAYGTVPSFVENATGRATVEAQTIIHPGGGAPYGVVIVTTADGHRTLARVPQADATTFALMEDADRFVIGIAGTLSMVDDIPEWSIA